MSDKKFSNLDKAYPLSGRDVVALTQFDSGGNLISTQTTLADIMLYVSTDLTFGSVNEGLERTSDGQYFKVLNSSTNSVEIYRNDAGKATRIRDEISQSINDITEIAEEIRTIRREVGEDLTKVEKLTEQVEKSTGEAKEAAKEAKENAQKAAESAEKVLAAEEGALNAAKEAKESADAAKQASETAVEASKEIAKANDTIQKVLNAYQIKHLGKVGTPLVINPDDAGMQTLTIEGVHTINMDTIKNTDGVFRQVTLYITSAKDGSIVNWGNSVRWSNGRIPTLSYATGSVDIVTLVTLDNGATWFGMHNGGWLNVQ